MQYSRCSLYPLQSSVERSLIVWSVGHVWSLSERLMHHSTFSPTPLRAADADALPADARVPVVDWNNGVWRSFPFCMCADKLN